MFGKASHHVSGSPNTPKLTAAHHLGPGDILAHASTPAPPPHNTTAKRMCTRTTCCVPPLFTQLLTTTCSTLLPNRHPPAPPSSNSLLFRHHDPCCCLHTTAASCRAPYSHSMVLGGLLVMSYTTRFTLRTCRGADGQGRCEQGLAEKAKQESVWSNRSHGTCSPMHAAGRLAENVHVHPYSPGCRCGC